MTVEARRRWRIGTVAALALLAAGAGGWWIVRDARPAALPPQEYARAAMMRLGPGQPVAAVEMPRFGGPVLVQATGAAVRLDPVTARVLSVGAGDALIRPLAHPAQAPIAVLASAAAEVSVGERPVRLAWPTARTPDWIVDYRDGARVKVADDAGKPVAALAEPRVSGGGAPWPSIVAVAIALAVGIVGWRGARRRRAR